MKIAIAHYIWQAATNTWLLPTNAFSAVCIDMGTTVAGTVDGETGPPAIMAFGDAASLPGNSIDFGLLDRLDDTVTAQKRAALESKLGLDPGSLTGTTIREILMDLLVNPQTGMPALLADKDGIKRLVIGGEVIGAV